MALYVRAAAGGAGLTKGFSLCRAARAAQKATRCAGG